MKKFLTLLLALCSLGASAAEESSVILQKTDGSTVGFILAQNPTARMAADAVVITTDDETSVEVAYEDIADFHFGMYDGIHAPQCDVLFSISEESIAAAGLTAGTALQLFDAAGRCVKSVTVDEKGAAQCDLNNLPKAVYVVKTAATSYKFKK